MDSRNFPMKPSLLLLAAAAAVAVLVLRSSSVRRFPSLAGPQQGCQEA